MGYTGLFLTLELVRILHSKLHFTCCQDFFSNFCSQRCNQSDFPHLILFKHIMWSALGILLVDSYCCTGHDLTILGQADCAVVSVCLKGRVIYRFLFLNAPTTVNVISRRSQKFPNHREKCLALTWCFKEVWGKWRWRTDKGRNQKSKIPGSRRIIQGHILTYLGENTGEWTTKAEITKVQFLAVGGSFRAIFWLTPSFEKEREGERERERLW